jgi:energy-coupling factor transporter ATP-binding protein EcfA2
MTRSFEDRPATREKTPLLLGLVGPSASGKTYSALRLATGIQRVSGGEIFMIDTEARRGLHYADKFKFRHIAFGAPFSPLDYLEAIEHCTKKGAGVIVVDSMSHEHEGPGGVLEMHEKELDKLAGNDWEKRKKVTFLAWAKPKQQRRRLINSILQMPTHFIFCFRAKPKLKIVKGADPEQLGFMPIAGEEFVYEMVMKCLLLPGANGVPTLQSEQEGEKMMIKIPEQFRQMFAQPKQLSEDIGQQLAEWAAGGAGARKWTLPELLAAYEACSDAATLRTLEDARKALWGKAAAEPKAQMKAAAEAAQKRVTDAERFAETATSGSDDGVLDEDPPLGATGTDDRIPGEEG